MKTRTSSISASGIPAPQPFNLSTFQRSLSPGFTLLEMVMVLVVIALFTGATVISLQGSDDEDVLRKPAGELKRLARDAVRQAGVFEEPQVIQFTGDGFALLRLDGAGEHWITRTHMPPEMRLRVRHWGQEGWQNAAGENWMIASGGLCEPLAVRLEWKQSFLEMRFHPLTGGVAEETLQIQSP